MAYVPDRGHIVWLSLDPQAGHEQAGRRTAIALSPRSYNARAGLLVACPVTTQSKGYPFEVALPAGLAASGVILADQLKSLDWRARKAALICRAPDSVLREALEKAAALLVP